MHDIRCYNRYSASSSGVHQGPLGLSDSTQCPVASRFERQHRNTRCLQGKGVSGVAVDAMEGAEEGAWEARCILLLWLSILVLVPFDLATIDSRYS